MRTGKLPEHTFKRSVINAIRYRDKKNSFRAAVGHDGAVIGDMVTAIATTASYYIGHELYAFHNAINNVIAAGGIPGAVAVAVLLPEHSDEALLRRIMDSIAKEALQYKIDIIGGHTELVPTVCEATVAITAYGSVLWNNRHKDVSEGLDILMTKWTGIYGGALLADRRRQELLTRYPSGYIDVCAGYMELMSLMGELDAIKDAVKEDGLNIYAAHDVSGGGVFGALWQILAACNVGADISVASIPVKQEIIEVCEFFNINPYMLNGQGSMLIITDSGQRLSEIMNRHGINASVIGKTALGNDRVVRIGDEVRYLVAPKGDMLNQVLYGQNVPV